MVDPRRRRPSVEELAREVTVAMRGAGLEGELVHDRARARLVHAERGEFDLVACHEQLAGVPAEARTPTLAKLARLFVHPPTFPATWDEASEEIVPHLRTQMAAVAEDTLRHAAGTPLPRPRATFTPHLVFELVVVRDGAQLTVSMAALDGWGIDPERAFRVAGENLASRSEAMWLTSPDAPGVYRSPWKDGLDACRMFLPPVFGRVPLRGRAVVVAPSPTQLLLAGSDDPDGLFHLARLARRSVEANQALHALRPTRMSDDGESWEDWLPPRDHPAYDPLRWLRGVQEQHDAKRHAELVRRLAPPGAAVMPLPPLHLVQADLGGETLTVTVWREGKPTALPKADAVILVRGDDVLGFAAWDALAAALPGALRPTPTYPPRFLATDFPEDWQLGRVELRPWNGPLP